MQWKYNAFHVAWHFFLQFWIPKENQHHTNIKHATICLVYVLGHPKTICLVFFPNRDSSLRVLKEVKMSQTVTTGGHGAIRLGIRLGIRGRQIRPPSAVKHIRKWHLPSKTPSKVVGRFHFSCENTMKMTTRNLKSEFYCALSLFLW